MFRFFIFVIIILISIEFNLKYEFKFINFFEFNFDINIDFYNLIFLILVWLVRILVLLFSCTYMRGVVLSYFRFSFLLFVLRIRVLVLCDRFYWLMLGWDGLGVVSFCLIIFYMNIIRINNGIFTLLQNRFGDFFFLLVLFIVIDLNNYNLKFLLFLLLGCVVKRAQYPFNSWLLAAIRAPTPTSSLVHSSTLVVAGVYVILKFNLLLVDVKILIVFRLLRIIFSFSGLVIEMDIKKLIAYPTMNHVRIIIFFLSLRSLKIVYSHLNVHALFKSLVPTGFGLVILGSFHGQDRRLVRILFLSPIIKIIFLFSCLILAGMPLIGAFFIKDLMAENLFINVNYCSVIAILINLSLSLYYVSKIINSESKFRFVSKSLRIGRFRVLIRFSLLELFINPYTNELLISKYEILEFKYFIYFLIGLVLVFSFCKLKYLITRWEKYDPKRIWLRVNVIDLSINFILRKNFKKDFILTNWWVISYLLIIIH